MTVLFLDYYHPFAGLCNQLYLITNNIYEAFLKKQKIYIHKINIDIFNKKRVLASEVLDFQKTNENLKLDILLFEKPNDDFTIPDLRVYPVSSVEVLSCLAFQQSILDKVPNEDCFTIHFRLDFDCIIHYLFEAEEYDMFMSCPTIEYTHKIMKMPEVIGYCNYLLDQYFHFINILGREKKYYICTSIGKNNKMHDCLLPYLQKLIDYIGRDFVLESKVYYEERELNALVELLIMKNSSAVIGFEGSSFSEGYCYKVCPDKVYYFVNGIVQKIKVSKD